MALTDKQVSDIIHNMVILTDTREQKNQHILDFFDENEIPHKKEQLRTADYSFYLPDYPELGIDRKILVERKGSLNEIAGNFTKDRGRFVREFERVGDEHIHLVMENATWKKILSGSYRSEFNPNAFMASLLTLDIRYNCPVWFCTTEESPILIYNILKYELREHLKNIP